MSFKPNHIPTNKKGENACGFFQPLFPHTGDRGKGRAGHTVKDPAILLQEAHQMGLQKGLESGCEEAWHIARTTLKPGLRAFLQATESLCALNEQIRDHVSQNILSLALIIVKQILGDPVSLSLDEMSELKTDFGEALAETNRFVFNLHPDDVADLKELIAADDMVWPVHPAIDVKVNPAISTGEIQVEATPSTREPLSAKMKDSLSALLSTK